MSVETLFQKGNDECATPKWLKDSLFKDWLNDGKKSVEADR